MCYLCVVTLLFYLFQLSSLLLFSLYWGSSIINSPVSFRAKTEARGWQCWMKEPIRSRQIPTDVSTSGRYIKEHSSRTLLQAGREG